jgi:ribonucleoside-triphosphate reductase
MPMQETTDMTLFVRSSGEDIARWDRRRIVDALIRETGIDVETAEAISREVKARSSHRGSVSSRPSSSGSSSTPASLNGGWKRPAPPCPSRVSLYDVEQLMLHPNGENANIPTVPKGRTSSSPRGSSGTTPAPRFFQDIADAHAMGDIHLHGWDPSTGPSVSISLWPI